MVSPTRKRDAVAVLQASYRIATRRACRLVGHHRSTQRYKSTGTRDATALRARMKELAAARPRYGYRRIHTLLKREGWKDNIKRVYRFYRLDGLSVRSKPRKKRRAVARVPPAVASAPRERWAIDFVHDYLADGRAFRVLSVVDVFSRSSEILEPGIGFTGARVAELLDKAAKSSKSKLPAIITADNGTEFTSKALDAWAHERGVKLDFTTPGKPTENGFVESFQGRFRDECLNAEVFEDLEDAKRKIRAWRTDYNTRRPHSALGNLPPAEYLRRWHSERESKRRIS
jgi:putative transposase